MTQINNTNNNNFIAEFIYFFVGKQIKFAQKQYQNMLYITIKLYNKSIKAVTIKLQDSNGVTKLKTIIQTEI